MSHYLIKVPDSEVTQVLDQIAAEKGKIINISQCPILAVKGIIPGYAIIYLAKKRDDAPQVENV